MTAFRDGLRTALTQARGIAGGMGLHPYRVYLRTTASSGAHVGDGTLTETEVEILEAGNPPKVANPSGERSMASGDAQDVDRYEVGPLTQVAGSPWATLTGSGVANGEIWHMRIRHVETGEDSICRVIDVDEASALHVTITAVTVR